MKSYGFSLLLIAVSLHLATADEQHSLPPKGFEPNLKWLPEDTETLQGAADFSPVNTKEVFQKQTDRVDLMPFLRTNILGPILLLEDGKVWEPLADRKVSLVLSGARNYQCVSAFGSHRSEGCSIIVFDKALPDAGAVWTREIQGRAQATRKINGKEVFVFPSTVEMEPVFKLQSWQGTFLVLLDATTILCATSDAYLKEVLDRIDRPLEKATPLGQLPEWKFVEPKSAAWMIRQVPKRIATRQLQSVVCNQFEREFKVLYLPLTGKQAAIDNFVRDRWKKVFTPKAKFERTPGDLILVSIPTDKLQWFEAFGTAMPLYVTEGDNGPQAGE